MTFKFGNKMSQSAFKFGNKLGSNPQFVFTGKVNRHSRGSNGFDPDANHYYSNAGDPNYKPSSNLEKTHHQQLTDNHHKHM